MSEENRPKGARSPEDEPRTVLDIVEEKTGRSQRIFLQEGDQDPGPPILSHLRERGSATRVRSHYRILGEIARGGMGVILRGHDADLGRDVAIKVLDEKSAQSHSAIQRFVEEAQVGGQLQHPGVVPVYELGLMSDERPYFAMKLVKGRTLLSLLSKRSSLGDERRRFLSAFEDVCQTIAYAHSKGVVHRDLKPANVMVGAFGEVQVVDWGLSKVLGQGGIEDESRAREENRTVIETVRSGPGSPGSDSVVGAVMGTPAYMPPEQALGDVERLDERSDVFALGGILCEILTGRPPYVGVEKERTVFLAAHARQDDARARVGACDADDELKALCLECLAPARDARPRNAEVVARRLHEHLASSEERARQAQIKAAQASARAAAERRARLLTLALAAAVVLVLVTLGTAYDHVRGQERERVERARAAFDEAHASVLALEGRGRLAEALEVARNAAQALEQTGGADEALLARAQGMVVRAREQVEEAENERERQRRNRTLLARLEELRIQQINILYDLSPSELDEAFARAFREYGVEIAAGDVVPAVGVLRASGIAEEIAPGLDAWSTMRRREGWNRAEAAALTELAIDLDPEPLHTEIRLTILEQDRERLRAIATSVPVQDLGPGLAWMIAGELIAFDAGSSHEILSRGVAMYPDDVALNLAAGYIEQERQRFDLSLPYLQVALSRRPGNPFIRNLVGRAYERLGDLASAAGAHREAVRLGPQHWRAHYHLGTVLWGLGALDECLEHLEEAERLSEDKDVRSDILAVRYLRGELSREELDAHFGGRLLTRGELNALALALLTHPDPELRDPERGSDVAREILRSGPGDPLGVAMMASARYQLGDHAGVLEVTREAQGVSLESDRFVSCWIDFLRAAALGRTGDDQAALLEYRRAAARAELLMAGRSDLWARSDLVRRKRLAEAALGI